MKLTKIILVGGEDTHHKELSVEQAIEQYEKDGFAVTQVTSCMAPQAVTGQTFFVYKPQALITIVMQKEQ